MNNDYRYATTRPENSDTKCKALTTHNVARRVPKNSDTKGIEHHKQFQFLTFRRSNVSQKTPILNAQSIINSFNFPHSAAPTCPKKLKTLNAQSVISSFNFPHSAALTSQKTQDTKCTERHKQF